METDDKRMSKKGDDIKDNDLMRDDMCQAWTSQLHVIIENLLQDAPVCTCALPETVLQESVLAGSAT